MGWREGEGGVVVKVEEEASVVKWSQILYFSPLMGTPSVPCLSGPGSRSCALSRVVAGFLLLVSVAGLCVYLCMYIVLCVMRLSLAFSLHTLPFGNINLHAHTLQESPLAFQLFSPLLLWTFLVLLFIILSGGFPRPLAGLHTHAMSQTHTQTRVHRSRNGNVVARDQTTDSGCWRAVHINPPKRLY